MNTLNFCFDSSTDTYHYFYCMKVIEDNLGKKIKGKIDSLDRDVVFTDAFVNRKKAQIRGALSAVTVYVVQNFITFNIFIIIIIIIIIIQFICIAPIQKALSALQ